jgi:hypothetical protein
MMPDQKIIFTDGQTTKSISVWDDDPQLWTTIGGRPFDAAQTTIEILYNRVSWLRRANKIISTSVANVPFIITRNGEEVDNSANYQNVVGFFPNPQRTLALAAGSRQLTGSGYFWNLKNENGVKKGLKYLNPLSIEEVYNRGKPKMVNGVRVPTGGLEGFLRKIEGEGGSIVTIPVSVEDITFMWMSDEYVEIGPARNYPARAALAASGVLDNIDIFVSGYFRRGLIKATLLLLKGSAKKEERERLETWWQRYLSGVFNASINKVLEAEQVDAVTIGEGLENLENTDLTDTKREDIAAAFGIPESRLFSKDAGGLGGGGVVEQDDRRFMNETIIPETEEIYGWLNLRLFEPEGYKIEVNKKAIDVFQEDENERSESLLRLTQAFNLDAAAAKLAASILGYELSEEDQALLEGLVGRQFLREFPPEPETIEIPTEEPEQIEAEVESVRTIEAEFTPVKPDPEIKRILASHNAANKEIGQWQRHAKRKGGEVSSVDFETEYLKGEIELFIREYLVYCSNEEDIKSVFATAREMFEEGGSGPFLHWERSVLKAYENNQPLDFEPVGEYANVTRSAVRAALSLAKDRKDIRRIFAGVEDFSVYP